MKKTNVFNFGGYKKRGLSEGSIERLRGALAEPLLSEINEIFAGENKLGVAKRDRIELVLGNLRALGIDQSICMLVGVVLRNDASREEVVEE